MQGHGLAVRLDFARVELSRRPAGLFPHSWTCVSVRPSAVWWRAVLCRCNWPWLGVKQRLCSGCGRRGGCHPDAARFLPSHPGRLSLHAFWWDWSEQPENTERTGVALRQVIKSAAAVTVLFLDGLGRTAIYSRYAPSIFVLTTPRKSRGSTHEANGVRKDLSAEYFG